MKRLRLFALLGILPLCLLFTAQIFVLGGDNRPEESGGQGKAPDTRTSASSKDRLSRAVALIRGFEGYSPTCVDWLDGHATIGYGHMLHFGPCQKEDQELYFSRDQATDQLRDDLLFFKEYVKELVRVPINEKIETALISFSYNVGTGALRSSNLLRLLNSGQYSLAAQQFDRWIYGPDGPLPGLVRRREAEKAIFLSGVSLLADGKR